MRFGIIGSGSWATAIAKILTDNQHTINWWVRSGAVLEQLASHGHNPNYLRAVHFDTRRLRPSGDLKKVISQSDCLILVVPSAYVEKVFEDLPADIFEGRRIVSAVKGILPGKNILLNEYFKTRFNLAAEQYFTLMGPCHAEEIAEEKLSYLTFSGLLVTPTQEIASQFSTAYLNTIINTDIFGVQYAAVLKNIYALGAGIAHGLEYGDNFLSVFIANCADEMAGFLHRAGIVHMEVGIHESDPAQPVKKSANYAASVYLGDLLVTCYSLFSRNRRFGTMIGKGYSVEAAMLELNMVAEGYNGSSCIFNINRQLKADMPIAETIYHILWEGMTAKNGFKLIENWLV